MPLPMLQKALAAWPQVDFIQVYGMTEFAGVVTMLTPSAHRDAAHSERLTSAGEPLPGVEARVVDPVTLDDVPPGATGELWFRTTQAMRGYRNRPDATAETMTADGWVRTGDMGRRDDGGFVYVLDRLKDMIITGGENVYGPEVESVLGACPGVTEGVVIGVPDERWGETVKAVVVAAPGARLTAEDVIAFCRERLAHYQCPTTVDVVEALPRNGTGKVLKHSLREPYWAGKNRMVN
jgi:acyl-CoA synthetase (AMP-forming)/AMP-acid ligase II